jgi:hypothetical protein
MLALRLALRRRHLIGIGMEMVVGLLKKLADVEMA